MLRVPEGAAALYCAPQRVIFHECGRGADDDQPQYMHRHRARPALQLVRVLRTRDAAVSAGTVVLSTDRARCLTSSAAVRVLRVERVHSLASDAAESAQSSCHRDKLPHTENP